jgi:hypothetical protein
LRGRRLIDCFILSISCTGLLLQGCQLVCFQTKPPVLVHFGSSLNGKISIYFMTVCFISWQFGICFGNLLKYPHFGILCQEKSGNPGLLHNPRHVKRLGIGI